MKGLSLPSPSGSPSYGRGEVCACWLQSSIAAQCPWSCRAGDVSDSEPHLLTGAWGLGDEPHLALTVQSGTQQEVHGPSRC